MKTSLDDVVADFLQSPAYHHCLLLVHTEISKLEAAAEHVVSSYGWPCLCIGRDLAAALVSGPPADRTDTARRWVETATGKAAPVPLLITGIGLLFAPMLRLDPLALLRQASRRTRSGSSSDCTSRS